MIELILTALDCIPFSLVDITESARFKSSKMALVTATVWSVSILFSFFFQFCLYQVVLKNEPCNTGVNIV